MNTQFLTEFNAALVALLAVLNSTNSPVAPKEPPVSALWPVVGPSSGGGRTTNEQWTITNGTSIEFIVMTNVFFQPKTNWIDDETIKLLVTSGQVCRVRGHIWAGGCGMMGCLVIHPDQMRYCRLCGKTETRQVKEWE